MRHLDRPVVLLDVPDVLRAHARLIERFGGARGVRDATLLDSAVMAPRASFAGQLAYPTLARMAAAYLFGLAKNHPFVDGNKRVALAAAAQFLGANGHDLQLAPALWIARMLQVASEPVERGTIAAWLAEEIGGDVAVVLVDDAFHVRLKPM